MSKWRVGGKVPLNVYEGDVPMFQCHTPEQATRVVRLLNEGEADNRRLDWLERRRMALNEHYGTDYGWKFVSSHNVNRLFVRDVNTFDLNDAEARAGNIREAIDAAIAAAPASKEPDK